MTAQRNPFDQLVATLLAGLVRLTPATPLQGAALDTRIRELLADGKTPREIALLLGCDSGRPFVVRRRTQKEARPP